MANTTSITINSPLLGMVERFLAALFTLPYRRFRSDQLGDT
jgi:hypothetical protein